MLFIKNLQTKHYFPLNNKKPADALELPRTSADFYGSIINVGVEESGNG